MIWSYDKEDIVYLLYEIATLLFLTAGVLFLPFIVAVIYGETQAYTPFLAGSLFAILIGFIFRAYPFVYYKFYDGEKASLERKHAIGMVVLAWPLVSIPSALPYYMINPGTQNISYIDGFFEAISGWTTTGLTTFGGEADMFLYSINFWRHLTQYLGGLGIVIMGLLILMPIRDWRSTREMISAAGRDYRIAPSLLNTVKIIAAIYLGMMLAGTFLFYFSGMPFFDAICHSMSGFSTGGYSVRSDSLMAYNSVLITLAALPIMVVGSTNFVLIYYFLSRKIKSYFKDIESKVFWLLLILFIISFYGWYAYQEGSLLFRFAGRNYAGIVDVLFNVASALTTTGWNSVPYSVWSGAAAPLVFLIITISMVIGANTSSTGGGIKALRFGVMLKSVYWRIEEIVLPRSAVKRKKYHHLEDKFIEDKVIVGIFAFVFIYILVLFISFIIFLLYGYPAEEAFFEVTSAIGTVGLSSGVTAVELESSLKLLLSLNMWLGRIEVLPLFYFIRYLFGRKTGR